MKIWKLTWPLLLIAVAHCSSPAQVCPAGQLLVDGQCEDLCEDLDCNDDNDCTFEECVVNEQELTASCVRTDAPNGRDCDSASGQGVCDTGQCQAGTGGTGGGGGIGGAGGTGSKACNPPDCDDGNDCTIDGACNSSNGQCEGGRNEAAGQLCTGGFCDGEGSCVECINEQQCEDDNPCTQNLCGANACDFPNITGDPCDYQGGSLNGVCDDGVCAAPPSACVPNPCDDTGNDCTFEQCVPGAPLSCPVMNITDGTVCPPGNDTARCVAGSCVPWCDGATCPDPAECRTRGTCIPTTGLCDDGGNEGNGTPCTDGDGLPGTCQTGACEANPPTVLSVSPEADATDVRTSTLVQAEFDRQMDQTSISNGFRLMRGVSPVFATIGYAPGAFTATLTSVSRLALLETYTASLSNSIKDTFDNRLAAPLSWDFTTRDGVWGDWSRTSTQAAGYTRVAIDSDGVATAVWVQSGDIWANRFTGNPNASDSESIEAGSATGSVPRVAASANGDAIAIWEQGRQVWVNRFTSGDWEGAERIDTGSGNARYPDIAMDPTGNAVAVWVQSNDVYARYFRFSQNDWDSPPLIIDSQASAPLGARVGMGANGIAIAAWQQADAGEQAIWANRATFGAWGLADTISDGSGDRAFGPSIAVNARGDAVAVWSRQTGTSIDVLGNGYTESSRTWGGAKDVAPSPTLNPQVGIDGDGNGLVVWLVLAGTTDHIWANRYLSASNSWSGRQNVENDPGDSLSPQVAVDSRGNALIVWAQQDTAISVDRIRATRAFTTSFDLGVPQYLSLNSEDAFGPDVAVNSNGVGVAIYSANSSEVPYAWVNRFE